jgi:hypothetical protein
VPDGDEVGLADQCLMRGPSGDDPLVGQVPPLHVANSSGASVLYIADSISFSSPDHPILVVDLTDTFLSVEEFPEIACRSPFRCIPSELWSVDNNLNIANMSWEDFAGVAGDDGVFRGFGQ